MPFKDQLQEKLKDKIPPSLLQKLPAGFQRVGDIIILNLDESLHTYKNEIAKVVLELFPSVKTICNKTGGITGQFREPHIEYLAGKKDTTTIHTESGCQYKFDVTKIMFAKGNIAERVRIPKQVKKGEIIPVPTHVDVAPTILKHLGIPIKPEWGLDGKVVGLF